MLFVMMAALAFPGQNGSKVFENERVVIWSLESDTGAPALPPELRRTGVLIFLRDGVARLTGPQEKLPQLAEVDGRAILIELKDRRLPLLDPPAGIPRAFPREGAKKVLDTHRVAVWDFTWTTGARTPVHFHDKDVVVVYLGAGSVRSIPLEGEPTVTPRSFGEARFLARGRTHVEECIEGPRRDIVVELK